MGSHFVVGEFATPFRTYFSGDWDVRWGYGILTHGHISQRPGFGSEVGCPKDSPAFSGVRSDPSC